MSMSLIFFIILALTAVGSALGMLFSRNAIYAALFLVLNFCTVALFYLILGAPFIALAQVTVYAGAIMVLFLFVIMLLGAEAIPQTKVLPRHRWVAIGLGLILAAEVTYLFFFRTDKPYGAGLYIPQVFSVNASNVGDILFNQYLLPFEITSVLLLVAMIGAIVLTRKEKGGRSS
jgi:NADH-quinone oxidoreductase subunit J